MADIKKSPFDIARETLSNLGNRAVNTFNYFKQNPGELTPFTAQRGLTGQSLPQAVTQFRGAALEPATFGLIRNTQPAPTSTLGKTAKVAGTLVGSAPAFLGANNIISGGISNFNRLPLAGKFVAGLTEGALGMAATQPGGIKPRLEAAKSQFSPTNLALTAVLPLAGTISQKKMIAGVINRETSISRAMMDIQNLDVLASENPTAYMKKMDSITKLAKETIPDVANSKYIKTLLESSVPENISKAIREFAQTWRDRIGIATNREMPIGFQARARGGTKAIQEAEKLSQQVESATKRIPQIKSKTLAQVEGGVGPSIGTSNITSAPIIDPVQKIIDALKVAKPLEKEQGKIYSQIRSRQAGALAGIGKQLGGETGFYKKLGQLKGELPKVQFESIRKSLTQDDINQLFNKVEQSPLNVFEKINAQTGLRKLLGAEGGSVPTKSELTLMSEVFPPEFIQAVLDNRSTFQKIFSLAEGALNLPRAIMATADFSAPLRQGVFLVGRPKQWLPAFRDMFKYAFNENSYKGLSDEIRARPNYGLMRDAKLSITDMGPVLGSREEQFMSNLTDKIPVFGKISAGSNRAYSGFLNRLRADTFDDLIKSAKTTGVELTPEVVSNIGKFVNSATGRGDLGVLNRAAPVLNAALFSPRLVASRLNLLNPVYYAKLDPFTRKEALKSLFTFAGTAGTVLGLAKLGGASVGVDPRSSDFGKIKVGNTRYDILGGFQQYIKLASQLISGQVVSSTTGKVVTLGEGSNPLTRKDIIVRFFESKESPVASFVTALLTGQTNIGEPLNIPTEIVSRFIPLVVQDIYDIFQEKGALGLPMAVPGIFGVGSQTYGKQELAVGKNQIGQSTSQVRPIPDLPSKITEKVFGQQPLGSSRSYNVEAYYDQLIKMPRAEAAKQFDQIIQTNPDLAKKLVQVVKDRQKGITVQDKMLKERGVASGDRAVEIAKQFRKLKTPREKAKLWEDYVKKGIITDEIAKQLRMMAKQGEL